MCFSDGNGLDFLAEHVAKNTAVIVMTAHGEICDAINTIRHDKVGYLKNPTCDSH